MLFRQKSDVPSSFYSNRVTSYDPSSDLRISYGYSLVFTGPMSNFYLTIFFFYTCPATSNNGIYQFVGCSEVLF